MEHEFVGYTGSIGGTGFPAVTLNITNLGARQTSQLTNSAGFINLVIGGNSAVWTGAANGNWTTTAVASPKNWALSSNQAPTDYQAGDAVVFDDTATGTTNVNITDTNVAPALVTFNNNSKNYSFTGNPIVGTAGMILNGTGAVALRYCQYFFRGRNRQCRYAGRQQCLGAGYRPAHVGPEYYAGQYQRRRRSPCRPATYRRLTAI